MLGPGTFSGSLPKLQLNIKLWYIYYRCENRIFNRNMSCFFEFRLLYIVFKEGVMERFHKISACSELINNAAVHMCEF